MVMNYLSEGKTDLVMYITNPWVPDNKSGKYRNPQGIKDQSAGKNKLGIYLLQKQTQVQNGAFH